MGSKRGGTCFVCDLPATCNARVITRAIIPGFYLRYRNVIQLQYWQVLISLNVPSIITFEG